MKSTNKLQLLAGLGVLVASCRPDFGAPPSLVDDFTILAVRGTALEPGAMPDPAAGALAEARPGQTVHYDILAATPEGAVGNNLRAIFTLCREPKPPAESNSVSATCVSAPAVGEPAPTGETVMPTDACSLFGPITPPVKSGESPLRPRDPDSTGGFYVPVRAAVEVPGQPFAALAFALTRVQCNLAGASAEILQQFAKYQPNRHPALAGLTLVGVGPLTTDPAASPSVKSGQSVTLEAGFAPEASETYLWFDPALRILKERRESLSVSWFVTGGALIADRTGRDETSVVATTSNTWATPRVTAPTVHHVWLVLRDSRGGTDFAGFAINIIP